MGDKTFSYNSDQSLLANFEKKKICFFPDDIPKVMKLIVSD